MASWHRPGWNGARQVRCAIWLGLGMQHLLHRSHFSYAGTSGAQGATALLRCVAGALPGAASVATATHHARGAGLEAARHLGVLGQGVLGSHSAQGLGGQLAISSEEGRKAACGGTMAGGAGRAGVWGGEGPCRTRRAKGRKERVAAAHNRCHSRRRQQQRGTSAASRQALRPHSRLTHRRRTQLHRGRCTVSSFWQGQRCSSGWAAQSAPGAAACQQWQRGPYAQGARRRGSCRLPCKLSCKLPCHQ